MNTVLGTGIFFLPSKVMALVGPASLFVYLFVAIAALVVAFCFAECATLFSRNGAAYVYAREAFGDFVGFEVGIMRWISTMLGAAALAVGWASLLEHLFPVLFVPWIHALIIIATIGALALLNIRGIGMLSLVNNIAATAKLLLLFAFIACGIFFVDMDHFTPMLPREIALGDFGSAAMVIFFAFSGFEGIAVASEEMENPRRNVPIALFVVLLMTSVIYLLIHAVLIGVLGPQLSNTLLPIAHAAESFAGKQGEFAVLICMLVASFGSNVAASFSAPRSAVAIAQGGMLPPAMARFGRFGTPSIAIGTTGILTMVIALSGSFTALAGISVFIRLIQYFPTCLAVLVFRYCRPDVQSSFSPFVGTLVPIVALIVIIWMGTNAAPEAIVCGVAGLLLSMPFYFWQKHRSANEKIQAF